jgi:hypothetical protein
VSQKDHTQPHGPWNPGLQSELPREYLPLATLFRCQNVSTSVAKAHELSDYCGLPVHELVAFRAERLIVHELLVRVTARLAVPDGTDYEDLGRNFREIASTVLNAYILPHRDELARVLERVRRDASAVIAQTLSETLSPPPRPAVEAARADGWRWLFGFGKPRKPLAPAETETAEQRERRIVSEWSRKAQVAPTRLEESCFHALSRIATAITSRHGRLLADRTLLADLAVTLVSNDYGSEAIGDAIDPYFQEAVAHEGYRPLALQQVPVVMNVKGASASGKSTMRPLQLVLAQKLGFPWQDFALISPDIWRKFLLDYASLGAAYKYAGTLTGHEIEIIDNKLDRHMATKSARREMSHLLIDRFRFDSFIPISDGKEPSRLLTRFGDLVYMFFMITPPELTVERAWTRGLKVGRYKAVEDLLAHNVEAYTGMPELFFTWALDRTRRVHYEFLDNSVAEGRAPRTVAFGWNGEMTILDASRILDIDRFRKINIHACVPEEVYLGDNLAPEHNVAFLKRCARLIPIVNFADYDTGRVYGRLEHGKWTWRDQERFARARQDPDVNAALAAVTTYAGHSTAGSTEPRTDLDSDKLHTLGAWGDATAAVRGP